MIRSERGGTHFELVVGFRIRFVSLMQFPNFPALEFEVSLGDSDSFVDHCGSGEYQSVFVREETRRTGEFGGGFAVEVGILSFEHCNALSRIR